MTPHAAVTYSILQPEELFIYYTIDQANCSFLPLATINIYMNKSNENKQPPHVIPSQSMYHFL